MYFYCYVRTPVNGRRDYLLFKAREMNIDILYFMKKYWVAIGAFTAATLLTPVVTASLENTLELHAISAMKAQPPPPPCPNP